MKAEKKTINFFQSGWCLIIGLIFAASGAVAIFISTAFKSNAELVSIVGFICFICGGILIYKLFVSLPNTTIDAGKVNKKGGLQWKGSKRL